MAIVRTGTFTTAASGTAQTLNLGFVPSRIQAINQTQIAAQTNSAVIEFEWYSSMPNAYAYLTAFNSGSTAITKTLQTTNGVTPYVGTNGTEFVPASMITDGYTSTNIAITGISKAAQAVITLSNSHTYAFSAADVGVTTVSFHGIVGMTQMNTLTGVIQAVNSGSHTITVNINSTNFSTFVSSGNPIINVITGNPPSTTSGFQIYNTPLLNSNFLGITMGSALMVTTADVWQYTAFLDASFTSD